MKGFLLLFSFFLLLGLFACSKKLKSPDTPTLEEKANELATKIYQKDFQVDFNAAKTIACLSKTSYKKGDKALPILSFTLYDPAKDKILFKETIPRATGTWKSDQEFEVIVKPERVGRMATLEKRQGWIYNLQSMKKIKK
ncbi:MAG: hypothetical protein AAGJ18_09690 [Bacteroidota bacterium]